MLKTIFVFSILIYVLVAMIDPAKVMEHFGKIDPQEVTLLNIDLGRTINGRTIMAYGLTKIKQLKANPQLYNQIPSILLISYLHPTDQNAVNLLSSYLTSAIINHKNDYYLTYTLTNGVIWFVPHLNIDAYEQFERNGKFAEMSNQMKYKFRKNRHLYPEPNQQQLCRQQWMNGVDIDLNFMAEQNNKQNHCDPNYGGSKSISEGQSKAVQNLFKKLNIKIAIILQSMGDEWTYPQSYKNHTLKPLYQNILQKLEKAKYKVQSNSINHPKGLQQWIAQKNILVFSHYIGDKHFLSKQQADPLFKLSFPVIDMLVKKACPIFQKYRNEDSIVIASLSVVEFELSVQILIKSQGYMKKKSYIMRPNKYIIIDLDKYLLQNLDQLTIKSVVPDTLISEQIPVKDIIQDSQMIIKIKKQRDIEEDSSYFYDIGKIVIFIICLNRMLFYIWKQLKNFMLEKNNKRQDQERDRLIY